MDDARRHACLSGGNAANYLITRFDWRGAVPQNMIQIKSPTRYLVILGRSSADGDDEDYKAVNALQAQYAVVPLSSYGRNRRHRYCRRWKEAGRLRLL